MPEGYVTYNVCCERCKRLEEEDKRQNERLTQLENSVDEINRLARSTEKLAANMELMLEEQKEQGRRISKLENRDGERWRKIVETVIAVVVSGVVGFMLAHIGM